MRERLARVSGPFDPGSDARLPVARSARLRVCPPEVITRKDGAPPHRVQWQEHEDDATHWRGGPPRPPLTCQQRTLLEY